MRGVDYRGRSVLVLITNWLILTAWGIWKWLGLIFVAALVAVVLFDFLILLPIRIVKPGHPEAFGQWLLCGALLAVFGIICLVVYRFSRTRR